MPEKSAIQTIGDLIEDYMSGLPTGKICTKYGMHIYDVRDVINTHYRGTMHIKEPEMYITIKSKV